MLRVLVTLKQLQDCVRTIARLCIENQLPLSNREGTIADPLGGAYGISSPKTIKDLMELGTPQLG